MCFDDKTSEASTTKVKMTCSASIAQRICCNSHSHSCTNMCTKKKSSLVAARHVLLMQSWRWNIWTTSKPWAQDLLITEFRWAKTFVRQHGSVLQGKLWRIVYTRSSGQDEGAKELAQTVNWVRRGFVGPCAMDSVKAGCTLNAEKLVVAGAASFPEVDTDRLWNQTLVHSLEAILADILWCRTEQRATHGLMNSVLKHFWRRDLLIWDMYTIAQPAWLWFPSPTCHIITELQFATFCPVVFVRFDHLEPHIFFKFTWALLFSTVRAVLL